MACALLLLLLAGATTATAAGHLDRTFGTNGRVVTPITFNDRGYAVALQPDGKVVVAGGSTEGPFFHTALARYNTDGSLDDGTASDSTPGDSFGTNGKVVINLSAASNVANALAIQSDGKIVIAGYVTSGEHADFLVVRFNANGTLDETFGDGDGVVTSITPTTDVAHAIAFQTINGEERIVVAGSAGSANSKFAVVRYTSNGTLDETFGTGGIVVTSINNLLDVANDVAIEQTATGDKIVVAGYSKLDFGGGSFNKDIAVVRYNSNGTLDNSFDADGKLTTNLSDSDEARAVLIQKVNGQNKIVVGGFAVRSGSDDFTLVRYNDNGAIDTTFGPGCRVLTAIGTDDEQILALALQTDNKIVAAGFSYSGGVGTFNQDFALVRYHPNGTLDTSFGSCGKIVTANANGGTGNDLLYGVAVQPDGKIIAAGHTTTTGLPAPNDDFAVLRYLPEGHAASPSSVDFDGDGRADISVFRPGDGRWYLNCSCAAQRTVTFGLADDKPVPADYDGDGRTDVAVFRPSEGIWYIQRSSDGSVNGLQWGLSTDKPVPADYDGDGKADVAVFRPDNGMWYILQSSNGSRAQQFGGAADRPVPGDYDGDGQWDIAVYRPDEGKWYILKSVDGSMAEHYWGLSTDEPVAGDYDGDGQWDVAVWRPSTGVWYTLRSSNGASTGQSWGRADLGDRPVPGDYDGDGKNDLAVFRSTGTWYILQSTNNSLRTQFWGLGTDVPLH